MLPALVVALALVAVVVVGLAWQRGEGRLRRGSGERIRPDEVFLPASAFGTAATLLLFTSPFDTRYGEVRSVLESAAGPGVAIAEVDLAARGDLAGKYAVTRTPTTFVLDGQGRLLARIKGVPTASDVRAGLAGTG